MKMNNVCIGYFDKIKAVDKENKPILIDKFRTKTFELTYGITELWGGLESSKPLIVRAEVPLLDRRAPGVQSFKTELGDNLPKYEMLYPTKSLLLDGHMISPCQGCIDCTQDYGVTYIDGNGYKSSHLGTLLMRNEEPNFIITRENTVKKELKQFDLLFFGTRATEAGERYKYVMLYYYREKAVDMEETRKFIKSEMPVNRDLETVVKKAKDSLVVLNPLNESKNL